MMALDVAARGLIHMSESRRRLERLSERSDDRALAVDLFDVLNGELPPLALDHTRITDLATRFGVEGILFEHELELFAGLPECDRLRFRLCCFVTDPFLATLLLHLNPLAACSILPPSPFPLPRSPCRPRPLPLLCQRLLEPFPVHRMSVLRGNQLGEIEWKPVRVVQSERVGTAEDRLGTARLHSGEPPFHRLEGPLLLGARHALDVLLFG